MAIHVLVRECLDAFSIECEDRMCSSDIQDELGRFKVWTGNMAAQHSSRSRRSLEYRLRDSSRLRETVVSLLRDLKRALRELQHSVVADPRASNVSADISEISRHQLAGKGLEVHHDQQQENEDEADDMFELSDEESVEETCAQRAINEVHDVITCLMRFSMALRNPARNQRTDDRDGEHIAQAYVDHYTSHVRESFPSAPDYLVDRLGRSLSKHRQYFSYRKSHNEKLREELTDADPDAWEITSTVATSLFVEKTPQLSIEPLALDNESIYTATSYEGSSTGNTNLQIPRWPASAQDGLPFECPLCFGILEVETEAAWRHHVFEDMPPYICTSETCESAVKSFSRRHEWARHDQEMLEDVWLCPYGCAEPLRSSEGFETHIRATHHLACRADPSAIRDLTMACRRSEVQDGARPCPLCEKLCDSAKRWTKHVGHHLEQLALFSLPAELLSGDSPDGSDGSSDIVSNPGSEVTTQRRSEYLTSAWVESNDIWPERAQGLLAELMHQYSCYTFNQNDAFDAIYRELYQLVDNSTYDWDYEVHNGMLRERTKRKMDELCAKMQQTGEIVGRTDGYDGWQKVEDYTGNPAGYILHDDSSGDLISREQKLLSIDATCDHACKVLDKRLANTEEDLARATDPEAKYDLEKKIVRIEAERTENLAARDRLYRMVMAEPPDETQTSKPVARKRDFLRFWTSKKKASE
jgi:hypothetical protein